MERGKRRHGEVVVARWCKKWRERIDLTRIDVGYDVARAMS